MSKIYPRAYAALLGDACPPAEAVQLLLAARCGDRLALIKIRTAVQLTRGHLRMDFMIEELLDYERTVG